jgi:hypothetical protein
MIAVELRVDLGNQCFDWEARFDLGGRFHLRSSQSLGPRGGKSQVSPSRVAVDDSG